MIDFIQSETQFFQRLMGLILLAIAVQFVINGTVSVITPLITPSF